MSKSWRLISYDVREPKRLHKVAKLLEGYGRRLQYSVFCCFLSDRETERLRFEVKKILEKEDDFLIIGLCNHCVARIRSSQVKRVWPDDPEEYKIIISENLD